ncbi:hypothetical protein CXB51_022507 [Gossypium anomalum]|uniref:NmrA-like domain-containing protein n=1 Tax=Gossypium anomalum TaxID=47600 RepID=A0A8J6CUA0_9ROSI|nr:hypothetical protein CXB51_022507 [Gossypium anomalum]
MSSGEGKTVCVTGASGYIASCLVKQLLLRGYTVKASVRDPDDPRKTQHLLALEGAEDRLKLFKANLLEEGSYDSAVEGCEGVFHTASPFYHDVKDPESQKTMAEDAAWKFSKEKGFDMVAINPGMVIGPLLQPTLNTSAAAVLSLIKVVKFLHQLYPSFQLPKKCADDKPYVPTYQVSKEKARSLGIEFIPLDVSLKETVESLKEKGFVDF